MTKVIVFKYGHIGDSITAVPSILALKQKFASVSLLTLYLKGGKMSSFEIFKSLKLFDSYFVLSSDFLNNILLIIKLRSLNFDKAIVLMPPKLNLKNRVKYDFFFRFICGIKIIHYRLDDDRKPEVLAVLGFVLDICSLRDFELGKSTKISFKKTNIIVGISPFSNMHSKNLPIFEFSKLLGKIYNISNWNFEFKFIGLLCDYEIFKSNVDMPISFIETNNILEVIHEVETIDFYIGSDTGIMHVCDYLYKPIFAIFSDRDRISNWNPGLSDNIFVYRELIQCGGCMHVNCPNNNLCLHLINYDKIFNDIFNFLKTYS